MVKNLKMLRNNKGVSQKTLGEQVNISQQSINKYENHDVEPDIKTLIALATYFHTSVDYLIGNTDFPHIIEPTTTFDLNDDETAIIENYRQLTESEKQSVHLIMDNYNKNRN